MKTLTKGDPAGLVPARTGGVMLPDELATPEKALEFVKDNKERAKPAK
jgi:NADH-quinone oxidoreductase subunit B